MNPGPINTVNPHGAGLYGRDSTPPTRCRLGNNPFGHNPECDCRDERPSQVIPHIGPDDDEPEAA